MYDTNGPQAETTAQERKPPTLADIVREKTDDGRRIIDFFLDVMEDRIDGAELCHRIDAAKQLVKYGSKDAAKFIARYRGVSCGHATRGRRDPADPCSNADATGPESAPGPFSEDLLTVLSAVDEDLMARLVRAQTADGFTVVEFLDDVMQDRTEGFKCHHRIAAAKELIVHIVRDEAPEPIPGEAPTSAHPEPVLSTVEGPAEAPSSVRPEPVLSTVEGPVEGAGPDDPAHTTVIPAADSIVIPAEAGTHPPNPEPSSIVVPAKAGTQRSGEGRRSHPTPAHPEPNSSVVPAKDSTERKPRRRRTRKQRRQHGAARAAILGKHPNSESNNEEEEHDKPAPVELTIAERRIKERLEQHWHEPDPYGAPIDSTHPGRSPPW